MSLSCQNVFLDFPPFHPHYASSLTTPTSREANRLLGLRNQPRGHNPALSQLRLPCPASCSLGHPRATRLSLEGDPTPTVSHMLRSQQGPQFPQGLPESRHGLAFTPASHPLGKPSQNVPSAPNPMATTGPNAILSDRDQCSSHLADLPAAVPPLTFSTQQLGYTRPGLQGQAPPSPPCSPTPA